MTIKLINSQYALNKMPGGEWHVKSEQIPFKEEYMDINQRNIAYVQGASADDLIALKIWADAVRRDYSWPSLIIPYLPGARQDRRKYGEALSAKVYADIINSCDFVSVVCIDPHSDVMPALINDCVIADVSRLAINTLISVSGMHPSYFVGVIAPDAGAAKRANALAELMKVPVYQALKKRNPDTGKLTNFHCETLPESGKLLVVDDICDGGGTFKGLAQATGLPKERLVLWVTHGIFSGEIETGAGELHKYFSKVITTDSHPGNINHTYNKEFMKILHREEILNFLVRSL